MEHENLNAEDTANENLSAIGNDFLPEGWMDWNTLSLDQMVEY